MKVAQKKIETVYQGVGSSSRKPEKIQISDNKQNKKKEES